VGSFEGLSTAQPPERIHLSGMGDGVGNVGGCARSGGRELRGGIGPKGRVGGDPGVERAARIVGRRVLRRAEIIPSPFRLIPPDDAQSLWSRGAKRADRAIPRDGRLGRHLRRSPTIVALTRLGPRIKGVFPLNPFDPPPHPPHFPTSREKEINLPAIGETDARPGRRCERKLTDATQAVDGDSLRRSSSTSLESCARSSRVRNA